MKAAKLGAIFLISIMALAGTSAGYAMWSETVFIDGTITTGYVDIDFIAGDSWDSEAVDKDVSWIECYIDPDDPNMLIVTVFNAYPCIDYYQEFKIHCAGTIPVHLGPMVIIHNDLPGDVDGDGETCTLEITPDPDYMTGGPQLHFCDSYLGTIHIHLTNDVPNVIGGMTYTFSVSLTAYQYNEYPYP